MNEDEIRQFMILLHKWRDLNCLYKHGLDYKIYDIIIAQVHDWFYHHFMQLRKPTIKEVMDNPFVRNLGPQLETTPKDIDHA